MSVLLEGKNCSGQTIIIIYIYYALINALSAHMIHINLNVIFYTHAEHSPIKTTHTKQHTERQANNDKNVSKWTLYKQAFTFIPTLLSHFRNFTAVGYCKQIGNQSRRHFSFEALRVAWRHMADRWQGGCAPDSNLFFTNYIRTACCLLPTPFCAPGQV